MHFDLLIAVISHDVFVSYFDSQLSFGGFIVFLLYHICTVDFLNQLSWMVYPLLMNRMCC